MEIAGKSKSGNNSIALGAVVSRELETESSANDLLTFERAVGIACAKARALLTEGNSLPDTAVAAAFDELLKPPQLLTSVRVTR